MYVVFRRLAVVLLSSGFVSCSGGSTSGQNTSLPRPGSNANDTVSPVTSGSVIGLRKVKNILLGAAPTDDEFAQVAADPSYLRVAIKNWMQTPGYRATLLQLFAVQFQQSQVDPDGVRNGLYDGEFPEVTPSSLAAYRTSFARTALQLIDEGQPFTATMTTTRHMLTTELMALYALADSSKRDDAGTRYNDWQKLMGSGGPQWQAAAGPVSSSAAADPSNALFLHLYTPELPNSSLVTIYSPNAPPNAQQLCQTTDPFTLSSSNTFLGSAEWGMTLWAALVSGRALFVIRPPSLANASHNFIVCVMPDPGANSLLTAADGNDWRMVQIRKPNASEHHSEFFDVATLRTSNTLVLNAPRVGFFTTPAFASQWGFNASNSARAAANQTLIASLGKSIDGSDRLPLTSPSAVDPNHAAQPACFACHQTLDPLRQFFRQDFSLSYSQQTDLNQTKLPAQLQVNNHGASGIGTAALGQALASHPDFAQAWTLKLCAWANSAPCDATDPEVARVAGLFASSNFNFNTLMLELMSSPLVTYQQVTQTATNNGQNASVARAAQFCRALETSINTDGLCDPLSALADGNNTISSRIAALPLDGYARGMPAPQVVTAPDPFYTSNLENLCALAAARAVDGDLAWASSTDPQAAVAKMAAVLLRAEPAQRAEPSAMLLSHYQQVLKATQSATVAMRSTFVAACSSAAFASVGM